MYPVCDLLSDVARLRLDGAAAQRALSVAFVAGDGEVPIAEVLRAAAPPESTWDPAVYADDLFIRDLVKTCMPIVAKGQRYQPSHEHLVTVVAHPPRDPNDVTMRRAILDELSRDAAMRSAFEELYVSLRSFRKLLGSASGSSTYDGFLRRLDILSALRSSIDAMVAFGAARSELRRIDAFGQTMMGADLYPRLVELLDYEEHLATATVKLQVGADGRARGLEIVRAEENERNQFYVPPVRRFFTRILLWLRGYRVSVDEIMARALDSVFHAFERHAVTMLALSCEMELYLGALGFRAHAEKKGLAVCLPHFAGPGETYEVTGLFNPFLAASPVTPVTCDIAAAHEAPVVVITGPNSGGKTRLLQSIGLVQLMAQGGLFVPAARATLPWREGLFASFTMEVSADQTEGRLGTELNRIRTLFERAPVGALVILDELCSGTNPSEGEEIFELVVTLLAELTPIVFVSTHFLGFAARLAETPPVAGLEFLRVQIGREEKPTYRFEPGVASTSFARRTAARLGVTRDDLLALIARSVHAAERNKKTAPPPPDPAPPASSSADEPIDAG